MCILYIHNLDFQWFSKCCNFFHRDRYIMKLYVFEKFSTSSFEPCRSKALTMNVWCHKFTLNKGYKTGTAKSSQFRFPKNRVFQKSKIRIQNLDFSFSIAEMNRAPQALFKNIYFSYVSTFVKKVTTIQKSGLKCTKCTLLLLRDDHLQISTPLPPANQCKSKITSARRFQTIYNGILL